MDVADYEAAGLYKPDTDNAADRSRCSLTRAV
jgi:hypothetical protein